MFVFVPINVQFYTEVLLFVRRQNKETYMKSQDIIDVQISKKSPFLKFYSKAILFIWVREKKRKINNSQVVVRNFVSIFL